MLKVKRILWSQYKGGVCFEDRLNNFFETECLTKDQIVSIKTKSDDEGTYESALIFYDND